MWSPQPWSVEPPATDAVSVVPTIDAEALVLKQWCFEQADLVLVAHDMQVDQDSRAKLAKTLSASVQRASLELIRWADGDFEPDFVVSAPVLHRETPEIRTQLMPALPFEELVRGWAAEKRPIERTLYEWTRVFQDLAAFVRHDDALRIAAADLYAWKAKLIDLGRKPKTIRDGRLAPVRAILQWAVDNGRLGSNVAERVGIDVRSKPGEKKRSFTDDEASTILRAADREDDVVRRWVPWLCAYSGARISEI